MQCCSSANCTKTYLDELERRDLLNFTAFLRKCRKKNGELLDDRTVYNRFENTITFLKEYGIRGLVLHKDWPTYEEEDAVPYTVEELKSLFAVADEEDFVRYQFFLKSGSTCLREERRVTRGSAIAGTILKLGRRNELSHEKAAGVISGNRTGLHRMFWRDSILRRAAERNG